VKSFTILNLKIDNSNMIKREDERGGIVVAQREEMHYIMFNSAV
jgi:hypothetical protein